jgi:hypothetical protein
MEPVKSNMPSKMRLIESLAAIGVIVATLALSGCAAVAALGGAAGGYAVAKDMQDGKLIDSK